MKMTRTKDQQAVIDNRGGTLLVSAAAGSGKTSVLVERVIQKVIKDGRRIDEFLIITFTKAAAQELRSRIASDLQKAILAQPDHVHLKKQMVLLYHTQICTIDAFCTTILREFGHSVNLPADFVILDEDDAALIKQQALDELLEERYENMEGNLEFPKLLSMLSAGKDDSALVQVILEVHRNIQSHPNPQKWIQNQKEELLIGQFSDAGETLWGKIIMNYVAQISTYWMNELSDILEQVQLDAQLYVYSKSLVKTLSDLERLNKACDEDWSHMSEAIAVEFPRLKAVKNCENDALKETVKTIRDNCKKQIGKIAIDFMAENTIVLDNIKETKPVMIALLDLVDAFSTRYQEVKRKRGFLDFSDVEHEAVTMFVDQDGEKTKIAHQIGSRFHEIMVDEYQDTNLVQNIIVSALSDDEKNLFFVGDVKQSIYRFRLADPTIFLEKYHRFQSYKTAKVGEDRKILLSQNFRSRPQILAATNEVFYDIMSEQLGELNYTAEEALYPGASYPDGENYETEFHVLNVIDANEDDFGLRVSKDTLEARFVAKEIAKLLQEPFYVSDGAGGTRPIIAEDIAILMRSPKSVSAIYLNELKKQFIPCTMDAQEDILETTEVSIILSFLQIIDNPRQDVPLVSVLQSPLYGFTAEELAKIRLASKDDLYLALKERAKVDQKCDIFLQELAELRFEAGEINCHELIAKLYEKTNAIEVFMNLSNAKVREENLIAFYEMACYFEQSKHQGLFQFLVHLRKLQENDRAVTRQVTQDAGGVKLLSIHRSKGLEYPVVFLTNLKKKFNVDDLRKDVIVHNKWGIGIRAIDSDTMTKFDTLPRKALALEQRRELLSEEMRLLYVAMTRAKEKLIMTYFPPYGESTLCNTAAFLSDHIDPNVLFHSDHMGQWLLLSVLKRSEAAILRKYANVEDFQDVKVSPYPWKVFYHHGDSVETSFTEGSFIDENADDKQAELEQLWKTLTWKYPHEALAHLPAQLTATQIMSMKKDDSTSDFIAFKKPNFNSEKEISAIQKGNIYHSVFQRIDLSKTNNIKEIQEEIVRIVNCGFIKREEMDVISAHDILQFFTSSIGIQMKNAETLHREYPFSVLVPATNYYEIEDKQESVLLQGVIDCWFEYNNEIVLLDFKSNNISEGKALEVAKTYFDQMDAYSYALEEMTKKNVAHRVLWFLTASCGVEIFSDHSMKKI